MLYKYCLFIFLFVCLSLCCLECRSFVLRLWKFLHVVALQKQHAILDSVVEELSPLPLSAVSFLKDGEEDAGGTAMEADSFSDKIQVCSGNNGVYIIPVRIKSSTFRLIS